MLEEQAASKYLTVFELTAPSQVDAQQVPSKRNGSCSRCARRRVATKRSILYQKIKDVTRQAAQARA